ncbi:hypothetical protein GCM10009841_34710 [Microlunatus panaciterrae]|uniref:FmdB family regulatory protein n=1 Tax=Microlunatus panaciterrae TaxID=400768 RepID=A0ABS2RHC7_9ACTN|nr:FmdB family zinc ribbon protein [Microlunatus panaciterrae]MBM7798128.1 putative FmdB family regulatory protein [Microlunatus panaciterrae]
MPTYQYRCTECGRELEVVQKFSDPALTVCPNCEGALRKVFNAVGVVFKGSGFYRTDSRTAGEKSGGAAPKKADGDGASKPEPTPKTEKPAASGSSTNGSSANGSSASSSSGNSSSTAGKAATN